MKYNNEKDIICPHCGYKDKDSWEYNDQDENFEINCGRCDLPMLVEKSITVTYSTTKPTCKKESDHKYITKMVHCKKRDYIGGKWIDLPEEKWEYFRVQECSICDDDKYPPISKEIYELEKQ